MKLQRKHVWLYALTGVVVGTLFYVAVIRPLQIRSEKAKFEKAAAQLENLYAQIVEKIGQPAQVKRDMGCGYASRVYERGPLSCSVSIAFYYNDKDSGLATSDVNTIRNIIGSEVFGVSGQQTSFFSYKDPSIKTRGAVNQTLSQSIGNDDKLSCTATYSYPLNPSLPQYFETKGQENLGITLNCGGDALTPHYKVDKPR